MKGLFTLIFLLCTAATWAAKQAPKPVDITFQMPVYQNDTIVLGYYYNGKMLVKDSLVTDAKGTAHITREEKYPEGIYVLYIPGKTYFDILMSADQTFTLTCDTTSKDIVRRVKIEGSAALKDFIDYQNYLADMRQVTQRISERFQQTPETDKEGRQKIRQEYADTEASIKAHNEEVIAKYRGTDDDFLAVFLTALKDVEVPTFDEAPDTLRQNLRYYYYRDHYFDNINLTDDRLLRIPFIVSKIDKFFNDVVLQHPDTAAAQAVALIERTRANHDVFQFYTSHLYNYFNNSKIMGMDAGLVAIADKYNLSGVADWAEEMFVNDLRETVDCLRHCLVNRTAHDMNMISPTGEWFRLHEVDAPFTILVFWEPSCGHCKKEIPLLKEKIWNNYAKDGVKIFAVYCQTDRKEWEEFIEKHQLEEWMNVYDPYGRTGFRKYYNIKSTPQIFILDKDKTIIAKKIGVDQIGDFLDYMLQK